MLVLLMLLYPVMKILFDRSRVGTIAPGLAVLHVLMRRIASGASAQDGFCAAVTALPMLPGGSIDLPEIPSVLPLMRLTWVLGQYSKLGFA